MIGKTVDGILARGYKIAYLSTINVTNISLRITVDKRWIWIFQKFPLLGVCNSIEVVVTQHSTVQLILYSTEHYSEKMKRKAIYHLYKYIERNYETFKFFSGKECNCLFQRWMMKCLHEIQTCRCIIDIIKLGSNILALTYERCDLLACWLCYWCAHDAVIFHFV